MVLDEVKPLWGAKAGKTEPLKHRLPPSSTAAFSMNTDLGQHILQNPKIAESIVTHAQIRSTDHVLEIGPGTGNLTKYILSQAAHVTVIEMDPRMAKELNNRFAEEISTGKLQILLGDCLKVSYPENLDLVISNTPYQISSPLTYKLLGLRGSQRPRQMVLMYQHEFILRMIASPNTSAYGRLSCAVAQFAKSCEIIMKVGKHNFRPPPKVESSVVNVELKDENEEVAFEEYDEFLRHCFTRKNKTLGATFKMAIKELEDIKEKRTGSREERETVREDIERALDTSGMKDKRPGKMTNEDFLLVLKEFHKNGVYCS